jgi:hypothetical protein
MTTFELAKKYYDRKLWTKEQVKFLVNKTNGITPEQYFKITGEIYYEDLKSSKKGNLDRLDKDVASRKTQWIEIKTTAEKEIKKSFDNYINVKTTLCGSDFVNRVFKELDSRIFNDYNQISISSSLDKEAVKRLIDSIEQGDRKIKGGRNQWTAA